MVDVSSTGVAAAIVLSKVGAPKPVVVWTKAVPGMPSSEFHLASQTRQILNTLTKLTAALESNGLPSFMVHHPRLRLTNTLVSISAPWSYTLPTPVVYQAPQPFMVTKKNFQQLLTTATAQIQASAEKKTLFKELELEILAGETTGVAANDYATKNPLGQVVHRLEFNSDITVAHGKLVTAVRRLQNTVAPATKLTIRSFMYCMQQQALTHTVPEQLYGLIDVSGEATEIGVVSDQQLRVSRNNELGINELVRNLSHVSHQPFTSAYTMLLEESNGQQPKLTTSQKRAWQQVISKYLTTQSDLINRCAQAVELPNHFILYSNPPTHDIALSVVRGVIDQKLPGATVSLVSDKVLDVIVNDEPRLAILASAFHNQTQQPQYIT